MILLKYDHSKSNRKKPYYFTDGENMISGYLTETQMKLVRKTMLQAGIDVDDRTTDETIRYNVFAQSVIGLALVDASLSLDQARALYSGSVLGIDNKRNRIILDSKKLQKVNK